MFLFDEISVQSRGERLTDTTFFNFEIIRVSTDIKVILKKNLQKYNQSLLQCN